ncbi:zinc finger protein 62 homolog isoform X2 [Sitodiplosis mosellana]|uniref:zinc finger protein 62 homolog isoform X2 n=1 Tax=Sitodiplosis mosellana TaxID=263140 RepID=UPI0024451E99|nr:zinc finger protein 62 homolog isoform X2 [Sitodiplosis mosellana]
MSRTKTVHQCVFCPQTFGSAVEKDDHILEHFAQETCADCDQSLLRIGSNLYTQHNAVTCIKRESKSNQLNIKLEPETEQNEQLMSVDPMNFAEVSYNEYYQGSNNQNSNENTSATDVTPSNTVSVGEIEIKMEPEAQVQQFISVYIKNTTERNDVDFGSSQVFQSQSSSTPLEKSDVDSKGNYKHECNICGKVFQLKDSLRRHHRMKHDDPNCLKFKCDHCPTVLLSKKSLDNHLPRCARMKEERLSKPPKKKTETHDRAPCDICGELFYTFWLNRHKKLKHTPKEKESEASYFDNYQCDICQRVIPTKKALRTHMRMKHYPSILKCDDCGRRFVLKKSLDSHLNRCNRKQKSLGEVLGNKSISSKKRHICDICGEVFSSRTAAGKHTFNVHKTEEGHQCTYCKRVFITPQGLINHGLNCEKSSNRTYECYVCHKKFETKKWMYTHLQSIHVDIGYMKIKCELCDRYFSCKSSYQSHNNRIHLNIRNFVCSTCGRAFIAKNGLVQHERTHTGERPFQCTHDGCDKTFRTSSGKFAHMRMHRGQKRFQCRIDGCEEQFGGVNGYRKHKLNVHGIPIAK